MFLFMNRPTGIPAPSGEMLVVGWENCVAAEAQQSWDRHSLVATKRWRACVFQGTTPIQFIEEAFARACLAFESDGSKHSDIPHFDSED